MNDTITFQAVKRIDCVWDKYEDKYGNSFYETSCHCDVDGDELNPISNEFVFCPYCSQKIIYAHLPPVAEKE
jgi:DNA-directed RNA polymerase subunit RPC12/RpoP